MSGFTSTFRGDGLVRVHRALDGLEADLLGLDRARTRFSHSPSLYISNPSGTPTRSASPEFPSDEQRYKEQREQQFQRRRRLMDERSASLPLNQFKAQRDEEKRWIWYANPRTNWMSESKISIGGTEEKQAIETIKKHWVEQGIWKDKWDEMAAGRYSNIGRWKHEELESESESPPPPFSIFGIPRKPPQLKPRRPKSSDEKQRIAEQRVVQEREREASRPYHQFVYQISKERKKIQDESENGEGTDAPDINTKAYEIVKNIWTKRGIWNGRWGILPGMLWKHEDPLEEEAADPASVPANPVVNGSHEAGEASAIRIFGSLVGPNHGPASGASNSSRQGLSADIDSARLNNGDAEHPPSASNSPSPSSGKQVRRRTTRQVLLPSKDMASHKNGQPANTSLGPVHPSKVSKAAGKRKGPQRRLNISQMVSSDGLLLSSGVDAAELQPAPSPDRVIPRRSQRIQAPIPSVAQDLTETASTDPNIRVVRLKPKRNSASNPTTKSSAKPQGITKPAKFAQGKARRK